MTGVLIKRLNLETEGNTMKAHRESAMRIQMSSGNICPATERKANHLTADHREPEGGKASEGAWPCRRHNLGLEILAS